MQPLKTTFLVILSGILLTLSGQPHPTLAQQDASLLFIENIGQFTGEEAPHFQARLGQTTLRFSDDGLWLTLVEPPPPEAEQHLNPAEINPQAVAEPRQGVNLKLSFVGANPQPQFEPFNPVDTHISYFLGSDPANWHTDVPVWGGVRFLDIYPGIDWEVTGEAGQLTQRLIVRENDAVAAAQNLDAILQPIHLQIDGALDITVDKQGQLRLDTGLGTLSLSLPEVVTPHYKTIDTSNLDTQVADFQIAAPFQPEVKLISSEQDGVTMAGASDLVYSTFLGGEGLLETGLALTIDAEGSAYVTGQAYPGFPLTPGAFDTTIDGTDNDGFVAKLSPDGTTLVYATFIGGNSFEYIRGIQVDAAGYAYVTGNTHSPDFPTTPGTLGKTLEENGTDTFISKLNPTGTALVYSTLLGGSSGDFGWDLAIDEAGYVYATGTTFSTDFPVTPGAFDQLNELNEAYAVKLNPDGSELIYATFLGGMNGDYGYDIAVNNLGHAYVAGWTVSPDFPVTPGAFDTENNQIEGYVAQFNADGSDLIYATFLGGSMSDYVYGIDLDAAGNVYLTGYTTSADFPVTPGAFDNACTECGPSPTYADGFVAKLNPAGSALVYASYLGGSSYDYGHDIKVSPSGSAYMVGFTYSADFPTTTNAFDTTCESCTESIGRSDAFVVRVNPSGTGLAYSTFLGGSGGGDRAEGLAIDTTGHAYVVGTASSPEFPVTEGAFDPTLAVYDAFVAKLATGSDEAEPEPTPTPTIPAHSCGPTPLGEITVGDTPRGVAVDASRHRVYVANFAGDSVSVIDTTTHTVQQTIPNILSANGLAYDAAHNIIWVSNYTQNSLTPIQANNDATNFTVLPGIPVGAGPWGVVYEPTHNAVFVANSEDSSVSVVNATAMAVTATLTETFNQPFHLAANPATGKVYVANTGHNSVSVIEGTTVIKSVPLWDSGRAYGITVDETRDVVYVATVASHRIVALGWANNQPDQFLGWASFQRGFNRHRPLPLRAIAVNPNIGPNFDGGHLWATTATGDGSEADQLLMIPKGWRGYFHIPFPTNMAANPTEGIAIDRTTNRVYASGGTSPGTITVVGDHADVCPGIYAASDTDRHEFSLDVFSLEQFIRSDITGDDEIDIFDLTFIAARYNSTLSDADVNGDGLVDILDLTVVAGNYGLRHPAAGAE